MNAQAQATKPVILIVEDHTALRSRLRNWMQIEFPHFVIAEAQNAESILALVEKQPPALILIDVGLPGMDGIEATRRINALTPETDIVVTTIQAGEQFEVDALSAGASAFVHKNLLHQHLIPIMEELLDTQHSV